MVRTMSCINSNSFNGLAPCFLEQLSFEIGSIYVYIRGSPTGLDEETSSLSSLSESRVREIQRYVLSNSYNFSPLLVDFFPKGSAKAKLHHTILFSEFPDLFFLRSTKEDSLVFLALSRLLTRRFAYRFYFIDQVYGVQEGSGGACY